PLQTFQSGGVNSITQASGEFRRRALNEAEEVPLGALALNPSEKRPHFLAIFGRPARKLDLTNTDLGLDGGMPPNYNVDRIEEVSVPGRLGEGRRKKTI